MAFEISIGSKQNNKTVQKIEDEILTLAYIFHLLTDEHIPSEQIWIKNTNTGEIRNLNEWTGTPEGEAVI